MSFEGCTTADTLEVRLPYDPRSPIAAEPRLRRLHFPGARVWRVHLLAYPHVHFDVPLRVRVGGVVRDVVIPGCVGGVCYPTTLTVDLSPEVPDYLEVEVSRLDLPRDVPDLGVDVSVSVNFVQPVVRTSLDCHGYECSISPVVDAYYVPCTTIPRFRLYSTLSVAGYPGEALWVEGYVENAGAVPGDCEVTLYDHTGRAVRSTRLSVGAGERRYFRFSVTLPTEPGTYTWVLRLVNLSTGLVDAENRISVSVTAPPEVPPPPPPPPTEAGPRLDLLAGAAAVAVLLLAVLRRAT